MFMKRVCDAIGLLASAAVALGPVAPALAQPTGGQVVAGDVTFQTNGATTAINQTTSTAIVNWDSFSVGHGRNVTFNQPGTDAAILNRVTGSDLSSIDGAINANGRVFLLNPNGIVVGPEGRIDARGGFTASTLDLDNDAFTAGGDLLFRGEAGGQIVNQGVIRSAAGDVVLISPRIRNEGALTAPNGTVGLAAGTEVLLQQGGDQLLQVRSGVRLDGTGVVNEGTIDAARAEIKAAGGSVYDLAINQSGTIRATGVEHRDGRILLTSDGGTITVSGTQRAVEADGAGGEILLGGDYRGQNDAILNAAVLNVAETAIIDASARSATGDGGRVILWADDTTRFAGTLTARAGTVGGDGGFAEISGKQHLDFDPTAIDLAAPNGQTGTLLLDPDDLVIVNFQGQSASATVSGNTVSPVPGSGTYSENPFPMGGSEIEAGTLLTLLASANVTLTASGSIYGGFMTLDWASGNDLTMEAGADIALGNTSIDAGTGDVILRSGGTISSNAAITANALTLAGNAGALGAVNLAGSAVTANEVILDFAQGITGDVTVNNAGNAIGTMTFANAASGSFTGALDVMNGGAGLSVGGSMAGLAHTGISIVTDGALTLGATADFSAPASAGALDIVLASTDGNVTSNAPAAAFSGLDAGANQRYLIYSTTEALTSVPSTTTLTKVAGESFSSAPPSGLAADGTSRLFLLTELGRLTLTANDLTRIYGAANPTLSYSVAGLQGGDTFLGATDGIPTLSVAAGNGADVGTYTIDISQGTLTLTSINYTGIDFIDGTLTITPATLTAAPTPYSGVYGDVIASSTPVNLTGFVNGDTAASTGLTNLAANVAGNPATFDAGSYDAVFANQTIGNYIIQDDGGTGELSITPRPVTITLGDSTRVYGDANRFALPTFTNLASSRDDADFTVTQSSTATVTSDVGAYPITALVTIGGDSTGNYTATVVDATLDVTPAPLLLGVDAVSRVYGAANPAFTVTASGGNTFRNGDTVADLNLSFTTAATTTSDVGAYDVTVGGTATNYTILPATSGGALTITPAALSVTVDDLTKTYGQTVAASDLTFTATGLVAGDTQASLGALSATSAGFAATADVSGAPYAVTVTGLASGNYTLNVTNSPVVQVTPATVNLTLGTAETVYGSGTLGAVTGTGATGLAAHDDLSALGLSYASALTADTTLDAGTTGALTATLGAGVSNYVLGTVTNGTATVTKATLTGAIAARQRFFGETLTPTLTLFGFVNGDTVADIDTVSFTGDHDVALADAGSSTMFGTITDTNYTLASPAQGALTILPRRVNVTVPNATKTYGDLGGITVTMDNLAPGQTVADAIIGNFLTSAGTASNANVGVYDILGGLDISPNYEVLSQTIGDLTVTPAPLDITMSDVAILWGDPTPAAPYTLNGLRLGHGAGDVFAAITPTFALDPLSRPAGPVAGAVSANFTGGVLASNYDVTVTDASMEVLRRPVTIAATDFTAAATGNAFTLAPFSLLSGGRVTGGSLAGGAQIGLRYGDPAGGPLTALTVASGSRTDGVLIPLILDANGNVFADVGDYFDLTVTPGLGAVINPVVPISIGGISGLEGDLTGGVEVVQTNTIDSDATFVGDETPPTNPSDLDISRAPEPQRGADAELMSRLFGEPSPILSSTLKTYLDSYLGSDLSALPPEEVAAMRAAWAAYEAGTIDLDTLAATLSGSDLWNGVIAPQMQEAYINRLMETDPSELTPAEWDMQLRYRDKMNDVMARFAATLTAAIEADREANSAGTPRLSDIFERREVGPLYQSFLAETYRAEQDRIADALITAGAASAAGVAAGAGAAAVLAGTLAASGSAVGSGGAGLLMSTVAPHLLLEGVATTSGVAAGMAGAVIGAVAVAAVIGVAQGVQAAQSAEQEQEVLDMLALFEAGEDIPFDAIPQDIRDLAFAQLMLGGE